MWDATGLYPSREDLRKARPYCPPKGGGWKTRFLGLISCLSLAQLASVGFDQEQYLNFQLATVDVGGAVSELTAAAPRWAAIFWDDPKVGMLVEGLSSGFDVCFTPPPPSEWQDVPNYIPVQFMGKVRKVLVNELHHGRLIFPRDPMTECGPTVACGVVDKGHSNMEEVRFVNNLSAPRGCSVNERTEIEKYKFASVADAYAFMKPYSYMCKVDFSEAYRSVPLCTRLWRYHCYEVEDTMMMDLRLMFGHTVGPGLFTKLSSAVVRKVKAQGCPGTIGYLDDIIVISNTQAENQRCFEILTELVLFLGFKLNPKKLEAPTQSLTYLGIQLESNASGVGEVTASIDEDKIATIERLCNKVLAQQFIKLQDLEWMLGLMSFCAQVIWGARLFMRSGYEMLHRLRREPRARLGVSRGLRLDLDFWLRLLRTYNGQAVKLVRQVMHTDFFAVDSSGKIGMGGYLAGLYFAVTWDEVRAWPVTDFSPFRDEASSHINYLELYVIYYALYLWGERLRGYEVLIWTDNTTAEAMVGHLWGKKDFIPLLKEIWLLMVKYDVRLRPLPIRSKANKESDALSRQDWVAFADSVGLPRAYARALSEQRPWAMELLQQHALRQASLVTDYDDWMIAFWAFHDLWKAFGPFEWDGAVDIWASNTYCKGGWSIRDDATRQDWDEMSVYCNPPYSCILDFLVRFLFCKMRSPLGTAAVFVLPMWEGTRFWDLVSEHPTIFRIVRMYEKNTRLFTSPNRKGVERKFCGLTRWPVVVVRVAPEPLPYRLDLTEWASSPELLV